MIEALSLQDLSKPMNVSFANKKSGQNYMYNPSQNTNTFELQIPSISFNKHSMPQNIKPEVIIPIKFEAYELLLPNKDMLCLLYVFFSITMAIANLLVPYYQTYAAILLCPIFTITVLAHCIITQNKWNMYLGMLVILVYPCVLVYNSYITLILIFILFTLFCVFKILFTSTINCMHLALIMLLLICSLVGIIVYQVYPKSIHGIHASFLSTCILACTVVILTKKVSFKITAVA